MQKYLLCSGGGEAAIGGCQYAFSLGGGYWRLPIRRQRLRYWQEPIRVADAPISAKYGALHGYFCEIRRAHFAVASL